MTTSDLPVAMQDLCYELATQGPELLETYPLYRLMAYKAAQVQREELTRMIAGGVVAAISKTLADEELAALVALASEWVNREARTRGN